MLPLRIISLKLKKTHVEMDEFNFQMDNEKKFWNHQLNICGNAVKPL